MRYGCVTEGMRYMRYAKSPMRDSNEINTLQVAAQCVTDALR